MMLRCLSTAHKSQSVYPSDAVPVNYFHKTGSEKLYKTCFDCRQYQKQAAFKIKIKQMQIAKEQNLKICSVCFDKMDAASLYKTCSICRSKVAATDSAQVLFTNRVKLEFMQKMGSCCFECNRIFLKKRNGEPGFVVANESFNTIKTEMIEFQMCEFDHLTEAEQIDRYGQFFGPKSKGVSECRSYESKRREANKCQLLCLFCHANQTQNRRKLKMVDDSPLRITPLKIQNKIDAKREFVKVVKLGIGKCQLCGFFDSNCLQGFEFDHVDQKTKSRHVSAMINSNTSISRIKVEIAKCRLLCRFCHRQHSAVQNKGNTKIKRAKKE